MKMFWKLMLAIFVILGTTACTNSSVDSVGGDSEFFSFIASIESTRTDMVNNDGIWQTIWSGDDKLLVTSDSGNFVFTNSKEEPARFVSTDVEAVALGDATNIVITTLHENGSVVDSDAGKCGIGLRQEYARFPKSGVVSLDIQSAFFRLACDYDVTISAGDAIFSGINESSNLETKITLNAGDDIWVALNPCVEKTSVAIMVGDESVLTIGELELKHCVIYNFGKIVPKVVPEPEPEPEPEDAVVYLVPNDEWRGSSAWFAAYLWSDNEEVDVRLTDEEGDGIYSAIIPRSMTNIIFCRMNPAYTEFGWNSDSESDRVWAMTADLAVGVAPNNYFYVTSESDGVWGSATYDPNLPVGQPSNWAVAGTFNNWSDDIMYITAVENIFVKQS